MACVLAVALLTCAFVAQGQVIEEGGFPVKGGGVSGEPFSLSCPPRLYVEAGQSVLLSCSATAVPEEGVRYEWESLSGDGFHLLSASDELSPLFTAPLSGEGAEYVYRLTAMSVGVYETATVTVIVGGVSGGSVQDRGKSPGLLEGCDSFGVLEGGYGEGCVADDKAPPSFEPFEGGFEGEEGPGFLFPEAPGLPDRPSGPVRGGGLGPQTPPRLECPVAVFLEELETGAIECYASDAAGEEYLDYSWEPVGNTTRDYLDNPRLIPEDAPNPSVVAPEAPVYDTLESFRSGETTFRYRYRLTVTSRATGLSSSSEVEVYVSSSRPSVYCPLEIVVEEGETIALDCEGVDPLSDRMDYDEDRASILWEWEGLWGTSMAPLAATDLSSALFTAPAGSAGEEYYYIVSMMSSASGVPRMARRRVTVRVSEGKAGAPIASDDIRLDNGQQSLPPKLDCDNPYTIYEGAMEIMLDCEVTGGSAGTQWTWAWAGVGSTQNTDQLTGTDTGTPTFDVQSSVDGDKTYGYKVTVTGFDAGVHVTLVKSTILVTIKERLVISVTCGDPDDVYESANDMPNEIGLECSASGAPGGDNPENYTWSWSPTDRLTDHHTGTPTFEVPWDIDQDTTYTYTVTASADNADDGTAAVTITVLNAADRISIICRPRKYEVKEVDGTITILCRAEVIPSHFPVIWSWSPTDHLTEHHTGTPTFHVGGDIVKDSVHVLTPTATAGGRSTKLLFEKVTVTVRATDSTDPSLTCTDSEVYEGAADITLDCSVTNEPPAATYAWTGTDIDNRLSGTTILKPTFSVPSDIDEPGGADKDYGYTVTLSAGGADVASADIAVTVLEKPDIYCDHYIDGHSVPEGYSDFPIFECESEWQGAPGANPVYTYAWTARGSTPDTRRLSATDIESPTFDVPDVVESDERYEYTLTVSAENADDFTEQVLIHVRDSNALSVVCKGPYEVDEGDADIELECDAFGGPGDDPQYTWSWSPTANLTDHDTATPTFDVPGNVDQDTTYTYKVTAIAEDNENSTAEVTVTVKDTEADTPVPLITCNDSEVYEGAADFTLDCSVTNEPSGATYAWTGTDIANRLSGTTILKPTFDVPDNVDADTDYDYTVTLSASGIDNVTEDVTVTVLDRPQISCIGELPGDDYYRVVEGETYLNLDSCIGTWTGAPPGSDYVFAWTTHGGTPKSALSLLSATDEATATFYTPSDVPRDTTYKYLVTVSADNANSLSVDVTVTVLDTDTPAPVVTCSDSEVYAGAADFTLDCSVTNEPSGATYAWTGTDIANRLSGTTILKPTFDVPPNVDADTDYDYTVTLSASGIDDVTEDVTVTVLNKEALDVVCATPSPAYEGSADFALDCVATGAPAGSDYKYVWTGRGTTTNTDLLVSGTDGPTPTFDVPEDVAATTTYEYLLTVSAENTIDATAEVTVTVLNKESLSLVCTDPGSVYEGSEDITFDCSASGAPGDNPQYTYAWAARGDTQDTALLSATDIESPTFYVPDEVIVTTTYEYLLTASAANVEDGSAEVIVTVLARAPLAWADDGIAGRVYVFTVGEMIADILLPEATGGLSPYTYTLTPALPEGLELDDPTRTISSTPLEVSPRTEYTWQATDTNAETVQLAFFIEVVPAVDTTSPPVAESSPETAEPSSLESLSLGVGVTVSASSLDFGVQSSETQVSLDPMTDGISTHVSGLYHGGRMTLSPGGGEALDENGEMDLSIELASPVVLRRKGGVEAASIVLLPQWSFAESCEQLSSQTIGGLYTEVTLSDTDCRLLRFGGELDLTDVPSGQYAGSMDLILRSGEREETHSVEVDVTVIPAQQVITIGPRGVRFSTSRELPVGLTEEQNLSIYPHVAFLTEEKPHGVFELSNPSLIPLEISVSARFGYTEATENGREVVVEAVSESHLGDLSQVVDIHPGVLILQPGEKGLIRYGVKEGALAAMVEKGYAAFFDVVSEPRQYVRSDRMPEEVTGERTARVTMRVPGVYVPGEGASQLRATLLSISYVGSLSATFLLETQDHPFVGEVVAYDGDGRELGRRETLVYTRSRVHIPLDRMPEEGTVFLRFAPRGSDRAPLPASIQWDAPPGYIGGDIGAADRDRTRPPETLVQKP